MIGQPYTVGIALRYLRARSKSAFISFISAVSMLGIAVAVAVLIIVMAVIDGFETELEQRILSISPDATYWRYPSGFVADWPALRAEALDNESVVGAAPYIEGQGMVMAGERLYGVEVHGVIPDLEASVSTLADRLVAGDFETLAPPEPAGPGAAASQAPGEPSAGLAGVAADAGSPAVVAWNIVIGRELAEDLGVGVGDDVILFLPIVQSRGGMPVPRQKAFTVTGIFDVGLREFDRGLVFVSFEAASRLYQSRGRATGIGLNVTDRYEAESVVNAVALAARQRHGEEYWLGDWKGRHINIFRSIELTKPLLFIMLSLVTAIAAFNIVSTLIMIVREKRGDIAILRSMGAVPRNILSVFVAQGSLIGLIGVIGGIGLGLLLVANLGTIVGWIESGFGIDLLSADVYLIGDLPAEARPAEVLRICALAFGLAVLATLYPAFMASRQPPAEALRYE